MTGNQPTPTNEIQSTHLADLDQGDEELLREIDVVMPLMKASLKNTQESAERALQFVTYMGFKFCEIKRRLSERGVKGGFIRHMEERFDVNLKTIERWMKVSKTFAQFLVVDEEDESGLALSWADDIPEGIRFLSLRQALTIDPNASPPTLPPGQTRPKKNLLEHTMKFRGTLTKFLEERPINERDPAECYEIVTSLDPLVSAYEEARERCLEDEQYRQALLVND